MPRSMMKNRILSVLLVLLLGSFARGADDFASQVDVSPLKSVALQHRQTIKTFDSYARQVLTTITGRGSLDGKPAVYSLIDMAARPETYLDRNIVLIKSVPLRQDFQRIESI